MKNNKHFLDPDEQHTLTEQECELISFLRIMNSGQRKRVLALALEIVLNEKKRV